MDKQLVQDLAVKETQVVEAQQKKQAQVIGSMQKVPGMFIWKWDADTVLSDNNIYKVDIGHGLVKVGFGDGGKPGEETVSYRVDLESGHLYVQAINKSNALKKFRKQIDRMTIVR